MIDCLIKVLETLQYSVYSVDQFYPYYILILIKGLQNINTIYRGCKVKPPFYLKILG